MRQTNWILLLFLISGSITAQKINPDTLDIDQLNLFRDKAVSMRNTGRALTLGGVSVIATGIAAGVILMNLPDPDSPDGPDGDMNNLLAGFYVMCIGGAVGIPCTAVGIPLWAVGGSRKARAEITLQKFNLALENSMAGGLGIKITF